MLTRREIALLSTLIHRHMATIKRRSSEDEAEWEFRLNGFEELATKLKEMYKAPSTHPSVEARIGSPRAQMDALNERPKAGHPEKADE